MRRTCCVVAILIFVADPLEVRAHDPSWVGKTILIKRSGVKFGYTDDRGRQVYHGTLTRLDFTVRAERNGWLQVRQFGLEGWFPKEDAVLLQDALTYFTRKIDENPQATDMINRRATAWLLKGELDIALKDYDALLQLEPGEAAFWNNRGHVRIMKKDHDGALEDLSEAVRMSPKALYFRNRARAWSAKQEYENAVTDCTEALRLQPHYVSALQIRGHAWFNLKNYDKALADYNECLNIDATDGTSFYDRGTIYLRKHDYAKAIQDFDKSLQLRPNDVWTHHNRGLAWHGQKDEKRALKDYDEALRLDPKYTPTLTSRALIWKKQGQFEKAIRDYGQAIKTDAKYAHAYNNLAWLLATCTDDKFRDGKLAIELAEQACELAEWKSGSYVDTLAAAYAEAGDFEEAVRYQQAAHQDAEFMRVGGEGARRRLQLYQDQKAYRE